MLCCRKTCWRYCCTCCFLSVVFALYLIVEVIPNLLSSSTFHGPAEEEVISLRQIEEPLFPDPHGTPLWRAEEAARANLRGENVTLSTNIDNKIPVEESQPILVVSSWRSGSSFVGKLLSAHPGTYYNFEPLRFFDEMRNQIFTTTHRKVDFLANMFDCEYTQSFLTAARSGGHTRVTVQSNLRAVSACEEVPHLCHDAKFFESVCLLHPVRLTKVIRVRVADTRDLLRNGLLGANLKVVVVVRDPRGVLNSRARSGRCEHRDCMDPAKVCHDLAEDLEAVRDIRREFPNSVAVLRYEDLSGDPLAWTRRLFAFLNLTLGPHMKDYVRSVTISLAQNNELYDEDEDPAAENSRYPAFAWRDELDVNLLDKIQETCSSVMETLGYRVVGNLADRESLSPRDILDPGSELHGGDVDVLRL